MMYDTRMNKETLLEKDFRINGACKSSTYCFLNCFGCKRIELATPQEKKEAKQDLKLYRKKLGLKT